MVLKRSSKTRSKILMSFYECTCLYSLQSTHEHCYLVHSQGESYLYYPNKTKLPCWNWKVKQWHRSEHEDSSTAFAVDSDMLHKVCNTHSSAPSSQNVTYVIGWGFVRSGDFHYSFIVLVFSTSHFPFSLPIMLVRQQALFVFKPCSITWVRQLFRFPIQTFNFDNFLLFEGESIAKVEE